MTVEPEARGTVETALLASYPDAVRALGALVADLFPPPASSSALAWTVDRAVSRDVADTSAVASRLGVALDAILHQPLTLSPRDPSARPRPPEPDALPPSHPGSAAAAVHAAVATLTDTVVRAEALLTVPGAAAARERAELACQAHHNGWYVEAERLFLQAADQIPTEPFFWFGAGVAAADIDADRGSRHLRRAARYLRSADPAAAVYAEMTAALVLAHSGWEDRAHEILVETEARLDLPCPALSLHLALLSDEPDRHLRRALEADPLLDVDVALLGLRATPARVERADTLGEELASLDVLQRRLRSVDDGPGWDDDESPPVPGSRRFSLAALEVDLRRRLERCRRDQQRAREAVIARERDRAAKERELARARSVVERRLDLRAVAPVLLLALVMVAVAVVAPGIGVRLGPWLASMVGLDGASGPTLFRVWSVLGLIGLASLLAAVLVVDIRPRLGGPSPVTPEQLAGLEQEVDQRRLSEFDAGRRLNQAQADGDLRIGRILDRRRHLLPRRPRFYPTS